MKVGAKQRRKLVADALQAGTWSSAVVEDLKRKTGASQATLYRDRDYMLKMISKHESTGLDERRMQFLLELRASRTQAQGAGSWTAVSQMLNMERSILGLEKAPLPEVAEEPEEEQDFTLEKMLKEVRDLKKRALAGNSYTAVEKLLQREESILKDIQARDEAKQLKARADMNDSDIVEAVVARLASLPKAMRERILAQLED